MALEPAVIDKLAGNIHTSPEWISLVNAVSKKRRHLESSLNIRNKCFDHYKKEED